jgi:hypothetical protein
MSLDLELEVEVAGPARGREASAEDTQADDKGMVRVCGCEVSFAQDVDIVEAAPWYSHVRDRRSWV